MFHLRHWIVNLFKSSSQVMEIYTQSNLSGFLSYYNQICDPRWMSNLKDYIGIKKLLQLLIHLRFQWGVHFPKLLLKRFDIWFPWNCILNYSSVICFQFIICLSKSILIILEKFIKCLFIFLTTICSKIYIPRFFKQCPSWFVDNWKLNYCSWN